MSAIGDGGGADQNVGRRVSPADLIISCQCGAGLCRVEPIPVNHTFLFICCPRVNHDI